MTFRTARVLMAAGLQLVLVACSRPGEREREQFVQRYLQSVRDDTEFFRLYTRDQATAESLRKRYGRDLAGSFQITNREAYGDGTFDYGVQCGPLLVCIVFVTELGGKVVSADLAIDPQLPSRR